LGEHSPVDALIPSYAVDYALSKPIEDAEASPGDMPKEGEGWTRLGWVVDESMEREIEACRERNKVIIEDSDNSQLWWGEFATEWIKQNGQSILSTVSENGLC
jgi:carnitine O-acetyltransferase